MNATLTAPATLEINLETILPWGEPRRVNTSAGPKILRKSAPTDEFTRVWRDANGKTALKAAGIGWGRDKTTGAWEVCWWGAVPLEEIQAQQKAIEASKATDAAVDLARPAGKEYLGYQKAGIVFLGERMSAGQEGVLLADEQGLGKTIQGIGLVNAISTICRILVVCPNTLKLNWQREFERWLVRPLTIGIAKGKYFPSTDIVIINYDILSKHEAALSSTWDLVICDEAHYLKNPKSIRAKAVFGYKPSRQELANGGRGKSGIPALRKLPMTGTPILNKPMEIFPILHWLDPVKWANGFQFGLRYAAGKQTKWGWDFSGASNLDELQRELRGCYMIRRLKKDVLTELPPKRRQVIELESDDFEDLLAQEKREAKDNLKRMDELQARVELAKVSDDPDAYKAAVQALREGQGAMFTEMARVRYETGMAKVPQVIEFVADALENGKVLLFAHHVDVMNAYKKAFPQAVMVYGEVKLEDRQRNVDKFQKDPACNLFIGNDAAAEGLTLTAAHQVIFAEGDWVPGKLAQKEDRAHRIGQRDSVLVTHLVMNGSIDATMVKRCVRKLDVIDQALDRELKAAELPEAQSRTLTIQLEAEKDEPVPHGISVRVTVREVEKEAPKLTAEQVAAVHQGLQVLTGVCDGAHTLDDMGFSGCDVAIGHSLARQRGLSAKQAVLGQKLIRKYHRQLGLDLVERAGVTLKKKGSDESQAQDRRRV